jgi:hypothetical protein
MIMEQAMQELQGREDEFISDVYRGRSIAIFNHHGRWLVYLDHVLQHNVVFATAQSRHNVVGRARRSRCFGAGPLRLRALERWN